MMNYVKENKLNKYHSSTTHKCQHLKLITKYTKQGC